MAYCCTLLLYGLGIAFLLISAIPLTWANGGPDVPLREPQVLVAGVPLPMRLTRSQAVRQAGRRPS